MKALQLPLGFKPGSRALSRFIAAGSVAMLLVGLVLLYLLAEASSNRAQFEQNFGRLFIANVVVAVAISLAVLWVAWRLVVRIRQRRFGSKLLLKLAVTFALVGFAPGLLIYGVSYQFVSRSIESWFDAKVQLALDAGLSLGRVSLEAIASDLARKSRSAADQFALSPSSSSELQLGRIGELLGAEEVTLWTSSGKLIVSAGSIQLSLSPLPPTTAQIRLARLDKVTTWFEGLDDASTNAWPTAQVKVLVQLDSISLGLGSEPRYLMVAHPLPTALVNNALAVESVSREYQERALSLAGLKRMYIGTLTLGLFLAVFGALLLALALGNQIAQPLLLLAEGVEQVAGGDLTPKLVWDARDELGGLTRAFAGMTQQLADARQEVNSSLLQAQSARGQLQTILDNLTAGVLVLSQSGRVVTANPAASKLLARTQDMVVGKALVEFPDIQPLPEVAARQFEALVDQPGGEQSYWQQTMELGTGDAGVGSPFATTKTWVVRGANLPNQERLMVLDDITDVISAQRAQAWGEVARRLAHEIKNPLTPIQLSAERLERRLLPKLEDVDRPMLEKSVRVIVEQVDAMKRLVNEFRDFARLPNAELTPLDANELIRTVISLYDEQHVGRVVLDLQESLPLVLGDAQQLRQVIHNLVQNGLDAQSDSQVSGADAVRIATRWNEGTDKVRLLVQDSGPGFPDHILRRAFEPYVTTKKKGTGLGLAVVKKIADDHHARIELSNRVQGGIVMGAQVSLLLNAASADCGMCKAKGTT